MKLLSRFYIICFFSCSVLSHSESEQLLKATTSFQSSDDFFNVQSDAWYEDIGGFFETRVGNRVEQQNLQKKSSIKELRAQIQFEKEFDEFLLTVTSDFIYDDVLDTGALDFESGNGWIDQREFHLTFSLGSNTDVKLGRQILTWGTGDLLFINDLFPKDWQALSIGRDETYLKAPSDSLKLSFFFDHFNFDLVYTPKFDSDRFITGARLSYYNPISELIAGREMQISVKQNDSVFTDSEIALRAYRVFDVYELALYYYEGFWKSPAGISFNSGQYFFPQLSSYGASARGPIANGIGNIEVGVYNSEDDSTGSDPEIRNSEWRLLVGYEQEIVANITGAVQYYIETIRNYRDFTSSGIGAAYLPKQQRKLITFRFTQLLMNQNLVLSAFNFWSPSEKDGYLRFKVNYRVSDNFAWELGLNKWYGKRSETFFGQLESNSNFYASGRLNF